MLESNHLPNREGFTGCPAAHLTLLPDMARTHPPTHPMPTCREFLYAEEQAQAVDPSGASTAPSGAVSGRGRGERGGGATWRYFWAAHQRFFRHMCMAAKVGAVLGIVEEISATWMHPGRGISG